MSNLFEDNRLGHILLIMRKATVVNIDELANQLSVSTRTIRNDIKSLNTYLNESSVIEMDQGRCSLRIFNTRLFLEHFTTIMNTDDLNSSHTRMNYVFSKLLRSNQPVLTDDLAYEMSIGRSTLVKDINKLRDQLKPYELSIVGKTSKGLVLEGEETQIRKYIIENNYEVIYEEFPLDQEIVHVMNQHLESAHYEAKVQKQIRMYLTLMLDRFLNGHPLQNLSDTFYNISSHKQFPIVDGLIGEIGNLMNIDIPIQEKLFVLLPIVGMRTPDDVANMMRFDLDRSIEQLYQDIVTAIQEQLDITLEDNQFTQEFKYHLMFMSNRLRYGIHTENALVDAIRQKYPLAYEMSLIASSVIEESLNVSMTRSEIGFLTTYFIVYLEENGKTPIQNIAIVCETGKASARLVYAQLRNIIDSKTNVDLFNDNEVNEDILNQYDVILSTIVFSFQVKKPVIFISEIFDEKELRSRLEKVRYLGEDFSMIDDNWFVLANILEEDKFFILDTNKTYTQNLDDMIDALVQQGNLDEGFKQRLHDREQKATMVLGQGVAVPHMINDQEDNFVVSLGILPQPIQHKDQDVQLIFLLGLPKNLQAKDDLLIRMYDEMITIMKSDDLVDKIASARTYANVLRVLYKRK